MPRNATLSAKFLGSAVAGIPDGSFEPQRSSAGYVLFTGKKFTDLKLYKIIDDVSTVLLLSVDEFQIPKSTLNKTVVSWNNEKRAFPTSIENLEFTFTAKDFVDVPTAELLDAWFSMVYNSYTGAIGRVKDFAVDAFVVLVDHSTGKPSRTYKLLDVYPSMIDNGNVDHNSSGFMHIEVGFEVGKMHRLTESQMSKIGLPTKPLQIAASPVEDSIGAVKGFLGFGG